MQLDDRRLLPDSVVEHAVDLRRLIDAHRRQRVAFAKTLEAGVLMGLGKANAWRSGKNRQRSGQCFR